jgi:hypothetical protein
MTNLKPYYKLECDELDIISSKILNFISDELASEKTGWVFLNTKNLLLSVPELMTFFKKLKLYPLEASVTILYDDLPIHVDTLPMVAKINIPIQNTKGWVNRWYQIDAEVLNNCPNIVDNLGFTKKNVSMAVDQMTLLAEIPDQSTAIVFNSSYPHSVIKIDPVEMPRVILSVTFCNEPIDLLK